MTTLRRTTRPSMLGTLFLLQALPAVAAAVEPELSVVDVAERQALLVTTPVVGDAGYSRAAALGRELVLHRFAVEALRDDAADDAGARWRVVVYLIRATGDTLHLALLDDRSARLELPRPLGLDVSAGDSLGVQVESTNRLQFRVTIGYEVSVGEPTRFSLQPVRAQATSDTLPGWQWQAPASGRVMAFAGAALRGARELVLQDETGAVIWRERLHSRPGEAGPCPGGLVQLGAMVEAGRSYRLVVVRSVAEGRVGDVVQALVLPVAQER